MTKHRDDVALGFIVGVAVGALVMVGALATAKMDMRGRTEQPSSAVIECEESGAAQVCHAYISSSRPFSYTAPDGRRCVVDPHKATVDCGR